MFRDQNGGIEYGKWAKRGAVAGGLGYMGWRTWPGLKAGAQGAMNIGRDFGRAKSLGSAFSSAGARLGMGAHAVGSAAANLPGAVAGHYFDAMSTKGAGIGKGLRAAMGRLFLR